MDIAFAQLIELQNVDDEISAIDSLLDACPARLEAIERGLQDAAAIVTQAKDRLAANQKRRRDLESEVKGAREQIAKFKRQLNEVKTNKEYTALLHEIETAGRSVERVEEEILAEMISADDLEKEIKAAGTRRVAEEARLQKDREAVQAERADLEGKKSGLRRVREALLPLIPGEQLRLYLRIRQKMGGVALSPVTDDFCSICQMRIRPQLVSEIMEMKKVITCEACGRILYWKKPAEETAEGSTPEGGPKS